MDFGIRLAQDSDLEGLASLFDAYRSFYRQPSQLAAAKAFLRERFALQDSVLLLAVSAQGPAIGFSQLFGSFSSVAMRRIFILNDLYVVPEGRRSGVARALLHAAQEHALGVGAVRLTLKTAVDNIAAQRLYESMGYQRDQAFYAYDLQVFGG